MRRAVLAAATMLASSQWLGCDGARPAASETPTAVNRADAAAASKAPAAQAAVPLHEPGLPNAFRVSEQLYRGAQPAPEGFAALKRLGIKTVVNLRLAHSDRDEIAESGIGDDAIRYVHIPMAAWDAKEEEVAEFLRIVSDAEQTPVFVHCQHGADRTGTMVAAYRVVVQGWAKERAIAEMREGPFGFHEIWKGLPRFLRDMDADGLKQKAAPADGLASPPGD